MRYFHGSNDKITKGVTWTGQGDAYEKNWGQTDFYRILEMYRPPHLIAHRDAVFMVGHPDDIDLAGGGTEWCCELRPRGTVSKHDLNWTSAISCLVSDGHADDHPDVRNAARNYWSGTPHPDESVWEYLTAKAIVFRVEPYDEFDYNKSDKYEDSSYSL